MAATRNAPLSIAEIESQIAKVTAELEKARSTQFAALEKSLTDAKKTAATAKAKVDELAAKQSDTAAAKARLLAAQSALNEQIGIVAAATTAFNEAKAEKDSAQKFAKEVAKIVGTGKPNKKIKATKQEKIEAKSAKKEAKKEVKKEAKKAAKSVEKAVKEETANLKKVADKLDKKPTAPKSTDEQTSLTSAPLEKPKSTAKKAGTKNTAAKKPVDKKPAAENPITVAPPVAPEPLAVETVTATPVAAPIPDPVEETMPDVNVEPVVESSGVEDLDHNTDA